MKLEIWWLTNYIMMDMVNIQGGGTHHSASLITPPYFFFFFLEVQCYTQSKSID